MTTWYFHISEQVLANPTCLTAWLCHVGKTTSFAEVDSLSAIEISSIIGSAVGLELPTTLLFDYPSSGDLFNHLYQLLKMHIRDRHTVKSQPLPQKAVIAAITPLACNSTAVHTLADVHKIIEQALQKLLGSDVQGAHVPGLLALL